MRIQTNRNVNISFQSYILYTALYLSHLDYIENKLVTKSGLWLKNPSIIYYPKELFVAEWAPEGEILDQAEKESEEETLMNEVTAKLRLYQICFPYGRGY